MRLETVSLFRTLFVLLQSKYYNTANTSTGLLLYVVTGELDLQKT